MKKKSIVTLAVLAILALAAVPSIASANWKDNGKELSGNGSLSISGKFVLSGTTGGVSCVTELASTLTAGTSTGHVNSFSVAKPSECDVSGTIGSLCGTHSVSKVEKTGTWSLTAGESDIAVSGVDFDIVFKECAITKVRVKGALTLAVSSASSIEAATFSGDLTAYNASEEEFDEFDASGTQTASPSGTFGIKEETPPAEHAEWTKNGATLVTNDVVHLEGSFGWSSETLGGVTCQENTTLTLSLSAGTDSASATQLHDSSPSTDCTVSGLLASACGEHSLTEFTLLENGSATGTASTGQIHVNGLKFLTEFGSCVSFTLTGSLLAQLDSTTAATKATLSGELDTGGFGSIKMSGTLNLTEAQSGVYGINEF